MSIVQNLIKVLVRKNVSVEIDPILLSSLDTQDKITTHRIIEFSLDKLILNIGIVQSRLFATSNRLKWFDKVELLEKISDNSNEFRVKISEIRRRRGPEDLTSISEDFGVGISICIAESLYDIRRSTIKKLTGTGSRPDWKCQTTKNKILIIEAKGSTDKYTSKKQEKRAIEQKENEIGDIKIASITLLNENETSTNRFWDPPIGSNHQNPEVENHILRAGHYASLFSFLGNSRLSRYYLKMRKRLKGDISNVEQIIKNREFNDLRVNSPTVEFEGKIFTGDFYKVENDLYIFVGVDKRLLSFEGFIRFKDYATDTTESIEGNQFLLYKDGILIIDINNINYFENNVNIKYIQNYQENITISDIDEMTEIAFEKYFKYVLEKNGFSNISEQVKIGRNLMDLVGEFQGKKFYFEMRIGKNSANIDSLNQINDYQKSITDSNFYLVTNSKSNILDDFKNQIKIIGREELKSIARETSNLLSIINTMNNNR